MKIVSLSPRSSLITELRSDTLWGLIITALARIYPEAVIREILESYQCGNPFFQISSAFPYRQNHGQKVYFFPMPILHGDITLASYKSKREKLQALQQMKAFKRVRYVSKKVFQKFLNGTLTYTELFNKGIDGLTELSGYGIKETSVQHNTISRLTWTTLEVNEKGQLFTSREHFFNSGYGIFFLIRGEQQNYIESALRYLQHTGFGGGVSVGKGVFDVEVDDFALRAPETADWIITLSLYSPSADELNQFGHKKETLSYELEFRKGRIGRNISSRHEKDGVVMLREGSVFPSLSRDIYGRLIKVRSRGGDLKHDIYHNGMSFHLNLSEPLS